MKKPQVLFFVIFLGIIFLAGAGLAQAFAIENLKLPVTGNIVVGPGKTELFLAPGQSYTQEIAVTNQTGEERRIDISVEDFKASEDPSAAVDFLGDSRGPYSLKDYVKPEISQIILHQGQRLRVPVTISIPFDAEPGELDGAVMMAASATGSTPGQVSQGYAANSVKIITRVGVLFFVRVKGDALESAALQGFKTEKDSYEKGPVNFQITSQNTGNVHLSPYGMIEVKDMFGKTVDKRAVPPWFVLPKSSRTRVIAWNADFLFGKYTATITMNRGYVNKTDVVDTMSYSFWVIPWKLVLAGLIALILVVLLLIWLAGHIEWKGKKRR